MKHSEDPVVLCEARLRQLTACDIRRLTEFARSRLAIHGIPLYNAQDISQEALKRVLQGLGLELNGRRPRLVDVTDMSAFQNYLRGVISSIVYTSSRKAGLRAECLLYGDVDNEDNEDRAIQCQSKQRQRDNPHDNGAAAAEPEFRDLREELFIRLRRLAPRHLQTTIDCWEKVFTETDRIPPQTRKHAWEIRHLAQKVMSTLSV